MGGEVLYWDGAYRVNGQLAVSRAIGNFSCFYKLRFKIHQRN